MKQILSLLVFLTFSISISGNPLTSKSNQYASQILTENPESTNDVMGDFTVVDTDGITRNLYETLDQGNTVFIFIMSTTCGTCNSWAPTIRSIYQNTGSGQSGIVFWGISAWNNNTQLVNFKNLHNTQFPYAGTQGGGVAALNTLKTGQNFLGHPTLVVICPDRSFFFDVCRPPSLACLNPYFQACAAVPQINITFQVDMSHQTVSPDGVNLVVKNGNPAVTPMINQGDGIWSVTRAFPKNTTINYLFSNGSGVANYEPVPEDCRVGNLLTGFWRYFDVATSHSTLDLVCFGKCNFCPVLHSLTLNPGWNGISSKLTPENSDIEIVMAEILDELVILQNMTGVYFPSGSINTLGEWDSHSGYQIKVNNPVSITIAGYPATNMALELIEGWNLIPVISDEPVEIASLFGDLLNNVVVIKPVASVNIFWPEMNINTIGMLQPGESYYVKMSASGSILFE